MTVVVFGGANLDLIARPYDRVRPGLSNPGTVFVGAGGAGRNVAANLARLGVATELVCAVGRDGAGDYLIAETARAGVETAHLLRLADRSNYYVAIIPAGADTVAVSDMTTAETLAPEHVEAAAHLVSRAQMVVVDANLHPRTLAAVVATAGSVPLCLLPTSPAKAMRMAQVLDHAALIVTGGAELHVLTDRTVTTPPDALDAARLLRSATRATVIVSLGAHGIGMVAEETLWLEALPVAVVDPTGAGDGVAAAAIFATLRGLAVGEILRLARAAGTMTVTMLGATHPALSPAALEAYG